MGLKALHLMFTRSSPWPRVGIAVSSFTSNCAVAAGIQAAWFTMMLGVGVCVVDSKKDTYEIFTLSVMELREEKYEL